jgi:hypothetical protein
VHTYNLSTQEAEAGGLWDGLCSKTLSPPEKKRGNNEKEKEIVLAGHTLCFLN